jgi:insulysin
LNLRVTAHVVALFLLSLTCLSLAEAAKRDTRTLKLKNGLEVQLTHDPEVHRSAAALSVGVGYLYDPGDKMGLAHYLEHMLFLGTKKYPEVGSYKKYLSENSGSSNAYTGEAITNYFFEVSHEGFEGALDRFSDFFMAPLFDPKYAEREVNAVNSEHDKNMRSDGWRANQVQNLASEPGHPLRTFGTGNSKTLAGDNTKALLDFHNKYYAASIMKLAILSNLPLKAQAELATKYFEGIPDHPVQMPEISPEFRKPLQNKYRLLKVKTIQDVRTLTVEFPTIRLKDHLESKPASILGTVIGYEGKGSLLSSLKGEGLALGLSAGGGFSHPSLNSFNVNLTLTSKGIEEYERVLERLFAYIDLVRKHGIEEYTYRENQAMAEIDFEWKDPDEGMGFVAQRTALMQDYPLDEIETLPYLFKKFDPAAYRALIGTLTPENALVVLSHNAVDTDKTEPFYGTEYSLSEVGGESFARLARPGPAEGMTYPGRNEFIPYNLELVDEDPHVVWDDDLAKAWFKFDNRFNQPRVYLQFRIQTPRVYDTPRNGQLAALYQAAVQEGLNEIVYPIQVAGLSYALGGEKPGIVLSIGGYSERIGELLRLVTRSLKEIRITPEKFANIKESMIRNIENGKLGQAYARGGYYHRLLILKKQYTEEQALNALGGLTLKDVRDYAETLYERVHVTGVAHGNWTDEKVKESVEILLGQLNSKPLPEAERYKEELDLLQPGERVMFSKQVADNNNSIAYTLQVGEKSFELQAETSLIASLVESEFFTEMRTNQQLGYVVWSFQQRVEDEVYLRFVIQSANHSPFELVRRVEAWMDGLRALFDGLSDEEFERHRASEIVALEKKSDSLAEELGQLYYLATVEKGEFDYKEKLIDAIKKIKKEDVMAASRRIFDSGRTPRLIVLMRSGKNGEKLPEGVFTAVEAFKMRRTSQGAPAASANNGS